MEASIFGFGFRRHEHTCIDKKISLLNVILSFRVSTSQNYFFSVTTVFFLATDSKGKCPLIYWSSDPSFPSVWRVSIKKCKFNTCCCHHMTFIVQVSNFLRVKWMDRATFRIFLLKSEECIFFTRKWIFITWHISCYISISSVPVWRISRV